MTTWVEIVDAEPRVGHLTEVAEAAILAGDRNQDHPDAVYQDAKRYLGTLLGAARGCPVIRRAGAIRNYERAFALAVTQPGPELTPEVERFLADYHIYEVACTVIYDRLCEVYDRREQWQGRAS